MNKQKSFTLIELLVVIVIIGILAGVIMISTSSSIDKANIAKSKVFEESVSNNLAANMVSRWRLDGNASDLWGNNNGTLYNSPTWKNSNECISNGCLGFSGTAYVDFGDLSNLIGKNNITYSLWVKPSTNGRNTADTYNFDTFMGKADTGYSGDLSVGYRSDNKVRVYYENLSTSNYIDSINPITINGWTYVVVTTSNSNVSLYINGLFNATGSIATNFVINKMGIGSAIVNTYCTHFNGLMDEVRLYNAAISSSQIKQNYIAGLDSLLSKGGISKEDYNQRVNALAYEN